MLIHIQMYMYVSQHSASIYIYIYVLYYTELYIDTGHQAKSRLTPPTLNARAQTSTPETKTSELEDKAGKGSCQRRTLVYWFIHYKLDSFVILVEL